jgi:hypothetical protein
VPYLSLVGTSIGLRINDGERRVKSTRKPSITKLYGKFWKKVDRVFFVTGTNITTWQTA